MSKRCTTRRACHWCLEAFRKKIWPPKLARKYTSRHDKHLVSHVQDVKRFVAIKSGIVRTQGARVFTKPLIREATDLRVGPRNMKCQVGSTGKPPEAHRGSNQGLHDIGVSRNKKRPVVTADPDSEQLRSRPIKLLHSHHDCDLWASQVAEADPEWGTAAPVQGKAAQIGASEGVPLTADRHEAQA